jgi:hypothetical protein
MADALAMIESTAGDKPTSFVKWTAKKGAVVPLTPQRTSHIFTDSTGVWGHAQLNPAGGESTYQFCGTRDWFEYKHETPYSCVGGQFMIPASIDYDGLPLSNPRPMMISGVAIYPQPEDNNPRIELTSKDRAKPINGASTAPSPGWTGAGNSASSASANDVPSKAERDADGWRMLREFINGMAKVAQEEKNKQAQAAPPPPEPAVTKQPAATSVVPPIDPNDDPIGPGGFITPPELASRPAPEPVMDQDVERVVQVCVPMSLEVLGWGSSEPNSKMVAFKTATKKMIRELSAGAPVDYGTQFMIVDNFIGFDPATTDSRSLVRMVD